MSVPANGEKVVARIGFAQRWLDRARHQCTEGNLARGALTLVLADAEVHYALEATGAPVRPQMRRMTPAALLVLAVLIATLALASHWPVPSGVVSSPAPPLVRLPASSGKLLEAKSTLTAGSRPAPGPIVQSSTVTSRSTPAARDPAAPTTRDTGGRQSLGSSHISMSELIDLVLTAERTLRQEPAGTASP